MEGLRTKAAYSRTSAKPVTRGGYKMGNSGASKTWHGDLRVSAKGDVNKGGSYNSTYAQGEDHKKIVKG